MRIKNSATSTELQQGPAMNVGKIVERLRKSKAYRDSGDSIVEGSVLFRTGAHGGAEEERDKVREAGTVSLLRAARVNATRTSLPLLP